jgi:ComF family protein
MEWQPDVILPVPLGQVRLRQRGYNQVELITAALARTSRIPHDNSYLKRVRETRSQVGLDPVGRYENLAGAFGVVENDKYRNVLLVDDLVTSGATLVACSKALFSAGTDQVFALTIARA